MMYEQVNRKRAAHKGGLALCTALCAFSLSAPAEAKHTFTSFDVKCAGFPEAESINATGVVAGWCADAYPEKDFVRAADGTVTTFIPNKWAQEETQAWQINAGGAIVGRYTDKDNQEHGYLRAADGTITTIDANAPGGGANGINDLGAIVGGCGEANCGYVRAPDGTITTFDLGGDYFTQANAINAKGAVAGTWQDSSTGIGYGFLRSPKGSITKFVANNKTSGTYGLSINKAGVIIGGYVGSDGLAHGFVRAADGTITTFDAPQASETEPTGINDKGEIAGYYCIAAGGCENGADYGFLRTVSGAFITFNCPGNCGIAQVNGINASGAITGWYADETPAWHGFIWTK